MTKPKNIGVCETCSWWVRTRELEVGNCHVAPPTPLLRGEHISAYPKTPENWWCNMYKKDKN